MPEKIKVDINTGSGVGSFETRKLKGYFDALIFDSDQQVELIVESELGHVIFRSKQIEGTQYLPVRVLSYDNEHHLIKFAGATKYYLDEKLMIKVIGPSNTEVNLSILLCDSV